MVTPSSNGPPGMDPIVWHEWSLYDGTLRITEMPIALWQIQIPSGLFKTKMIAYFKMIFMNLEFA